MAMKKSYANMSSSKAAKRRIRSCIVKTSRWSCFEGCRFWVLIPRSLLRGAFIHHGDLPEGVYRASLDEVVARFGNGPPQRQLVTVRLRRIYALAQATGKLAHFVIFGSYVTAKLEPNDVDILLVVQDNFREQDYDPAVFPM